MFDIKRRALRAASECKFSCQCISVVVLLVFFIHPVNAQWTGGIEGGTVVRDAGNATRLRLVLRNDARPFSQYLYAEWLRSGSERNSYSAGYNPRYWFNSTYYTFGETQIRVDDFLGIDQEVRLLAGLGAQLLNTAQQGLFVELGLGGRSIEFEGVEDTSNEALSLARLGYYRTLADIIKFDLNISSGLSSEDVTEANSEVGLSLRVPNGSVRIAYRSRYLKIGDAESRTDNDSFVSFGYSF